MKLESVYVFRGRIRVPKPGERRCPGALYEVSHVNWTHFIISILMHWSPWKTANKKPLAWKSQLYLPKITNFEKRHSSCWVVIIALLRQSRFFMHFFVCHPWKKISTTFVHEWSLFSIFSHDFLKCFLTKSLPKSCKQPVQLAMRVHRVWFLKGCGWKLSSAKFGKIVVSGLMSHNGCPLIALVDSSWLTFISQVT